MSTTEETNPTEVCENCGKEIESYKMILHERFCKINIRKCPECNEPIQIDELEEHKMMKHQKQKCEKCGQSFLLPELKTHPCTKKMVECHFCGLFMEKNELNEHEYHCGGKSTPCEYCGINVPAMEKQLHLDYTCPVKAAFDKNDGITKNDINNNMNNLSNINNENNLNSNNSNNETELNKKTKNKNKNNANKNNNKQQTKKKENKSKNINKNKKELDQVEKDFFDEEKKEEDNNNKMNINPPEEKKHGVITMDDYVGDNGYMVKFAGDYLDNDIDIDDIDFEDQKQCRVVKK